MLILCKISAVDELSEYKLSIKAAGPKFVNINENHTLVAIESGKVFIQCGRIGVGGHEYIFKGDKLNKCLGGSFKMLIGKVNTGSISVLREHSVILRVLGVLVKGSGAAGKEQSEENEQNQCRPLEIAKELYVCSADFQRVDKQAHSHNEHGNYVVNIALVHDRGDNSNQHQGDKGRDNKKQGFKLNVTALEASEYLLAKDKQSCKKGDGDNDGGL